MGTEDGAQIRLRGQGLPGVNGGEPGDAIITVKIERQRRQQEEQDRRRDAASSGMSAAQALEILGLSAPATEEDISAAYRRLIKGLHPDTGGSAYFSKELNAARDLALAHAAPPMDERAADITPKRGDDVRASITVPPAKAKLGWSASVELPTGRTVEVNVPKGVADGAQLRLRGQGLPGVDGGEPGDALVTIKFAPNNETIGARGEAKQSTGGPASRGQDNARKYDILGQQANAALKDHREAVRLVKLAANQGHADAQWALGTCYADGLRGLPKDEREAARLFKLAADQGDADAQFMLGVFNAEGCGGLPQDEREATRLWKLAADQGHDRAQCNVGEFFKQGRGGLRQDEREAARLWKLAADQGNASAQCKLGLFYAQGRGGLPRDEREAVRLYKLAAAQGDAVAECNLGGFYAQGRGGLAKDDREAVRYYKLAADRGDTAAQSRRRWVESSNQPTR
jgi:TPR repeat protein